MRNAPISSSSEIFASKIDIKHRCSFPCALRNNIVNVPIYVFPAPSHTLLIATLDKNHLQQKFPEEFANLPIHTTQIDKQGKVLFHRSLLASIGIDKVQKGSQITFIPTLYDTSFIEIHFSDETVSKSIKIRKSIADSVALTLLTPRARQPDFSTNMIYTDSSRGLSIDQIGIPTSTLTFNF